MKDKTNDPERIYLASKEKDADIHLLADIQNKLKKSRNVKFVLTGSYAIEALTGQETYHEDIDANILTDNINDSLPKVASKISHMSGLKVYKQTHNRLEYDVLPNIDRTDIKKLEFQFHELDQKNDIPTVFASLTDSKGKDFLFRVKSLPYVIATWSIRISGLATNPLRELKVSDLEQFKLLLSCNHNVDDVLRLITNHPQTPNGVIAVQIFEQSINKLQEMK
jgi:hypothetical protein